MSTNGAGRESGVALPTWGCLVFFAPGFFEFALPDGLADGLGWSEALGGVPGCGCPATSRKRSCAVRLTAFTRSDRFSPGISTMMLRTPWVDTSASETPLPLTRASTMLAACLSLVSVTASPSEIADSVIRVPPSRSRPSRGFQVPPSAASP